MEILLRNVSFLLYYISLEDVIMKKFILILVMMIMSLPMMAEDADLPNGEASFNSAMELYASKKYVDAMKEFNEALKLEPNNYEYYYNRGVLRYKAFKDYPGAIADFKKVIELNDDYPGIYSELAYVELFNKNVAAMRAYLDLATQKNPEDVRIYTTWALEKISRLHYAGAVEDYNKAIELSPNDSDLYLRRGYAKSYMHKYKEAIKDYDKAIQLNPDNHSAYEKRAEAHGVMLRSGRARKDYIKSEQIKYAK